MNLNNLREERGRLIKQARDIMEVATAENRSMTREESEHFDRLMDQSDAIEVKISEHQSSLSAGRRSRPLAPSSCDPSRVANRSVASVKPRATQEYRGAFSKFVRGGTRILLDAEHRALQADSDTQGGYLVPEQFAAELLKDLDNLVHIREHARLIPMATAGSLGIPTLEADIGSPTWTSEILTGSNDTTMSFGKREMRTWPLARRIKVSRKLFDQTLLPPENIVRENLAYVFAVTMESAFMTGSGANQPLGLFTASDAGISTSRDVSTANTTTEITADGLINARYALAPQYAMRPNTRWVFHRDAMKNIRKLKDGNGQYLWNAGLATNGPNTILDIPYVMSEYAPNTFTTGLYVGLLGDLSFYWIAEAIGSLSIQRLDELYAETNEVGFIGRIEADGAPTRANAFVRVKLA